MRHAGNGRWRNDMTNVRTLCVGQQRIVQCKTDPLRTELLLYKIFFRTAHCRAAAGTRAEAPYFKDILYRAAGKKAIAFEIC